MKLLKGQCRCRAVTYAVADDFAYAVNCHCSNCRRATGAAYKPLAGIASDKIAIVAGEDRLLRVGDADAPYLHCGSCGSLLYALVRNGAYAHVPMGTLVDTPSIRPTTTSSSARRPNGSRSPTTCRNTGSLVDTAGPLDLLPCRRRGRVINRRRAHAADPSAAMSNVRQSGNQTSSGARRRAARSADPVQKQAMRS